MKNVWKKHAIGKRILALCLLITMLFDTVAVSATTLDGETSVQEELVEVIADTEAVLETESEIASEIASTEELAENAEVVEITEEEFLVQESSEVAGIFNNVKMSFNGYQVCVDQGSFTSYGNACKVFIVCYNSAGEKIRTFYYDDCPAGSTIDFFEVGKNITSDTSYVKLEARAYTDATYTKELQVARVYSEELSGYKSPKFNLVIEDIHVASKSITIDFSYTGDPGFAEGKDKLEGLEWGYHYQNLDNESDYGVKRGELCLKKVGLSSITIGGFEPGTTYDGYLEVYVNSDYCYETGESTMVSMREYPDNTFTTTDEEEALPLVGTFENISIIESGYGAKIASGTFTSNFDGDSYEYGYIYLVSYNSHDERIFSSEVTSFWNDGIVYFGYQTGDIPENAAYVRLEAVEAYGDSYEPAYSEKFDITVNRPKFSLGLEEKSTGAGSLDVVVSRDGDLSIGKNDDIYLRTKLLYGTSKDESTWSEKEGYVHLNVNSETSTISYSGLAAETTYYGKLYLCYDAYNADNNEQVIFFEQTIDIGNFTTLKNNTYVLREAFPDTVLRKLVIESLYDSSLTDDSEVTSAQLEKISYLSNYRDSASVEPVKDLTGITLLTNLTRISMDNNEIDSVENIDWSKLQKLYSLYLSGNNITKFPDLSDNVKLSNIGLDDNMLSEEELENVADKLPEGVTLSNSVYNTQRSKRVELIVEENYYLYGNVTYIAARINGLKCYTAKVYIDGIECSSKVEEKFLLIPQVETMAGEHSLKVEVYDGNTKIYETDEYRFCIIDEPIFMKKEKVYYPSNTSYVSIGLYSVGQKKITSIDLINSVEKVYATTTSTPYSYSTTDPRVENGHYGWEYNLMSTTTASLYPVYNTIPIGMYSYKINYEDGTNEILKDAVEIFTKETVIIQEISDYYANMIDQDAYVYLDVTGYNINPAEFTYSLSSNDTTYALKYVNYKRESQNRYLIKCKKDGWDMLPQDGVSINMIALNNRDIICEQMDAQFSTYKKSNFVYYIEYNQVINKLEIGIDDKYINKTAFITVKDEYGGRIVASGKAIVLNGVTLFTLKDTTGETYQPENYVNYYVDVEIDNNISPENNFYTYTYSSASSLNYWSNSSAIIKGTESLYAYYYSDIPYENNSIKLSDYSALLSCGGSDVSAKATYIGTYENNGFVVFNVKFDTSDLPVGNYTITLLKNEVQETSTSVRILDDDKFIMTGTPYYRWVSDTEISTYVYTLNTKETDDLHIELRDASGNVIEGLTTEVTQRYSNGVYVSIKGLNYEEAAKVYYLKVSHATLGEAYTTDGVLFYTDERGISTSIYEISKYGTNSKNKRLCGIYLYEAGVDFPVKIQVYKPYDTTVVKEITIANTSELQNDTYYAFDKEFYKSLPQADVLYDLIISDKNGIIYSSANTIFGYEGLGENETEEWYYTVDQTTLNVDSESLNIATITVKDYSKAPTFKSSNTAVAKVTVSTSDKGKATIKAVGEGTAEITITADGKSKSFTVTVISTVPKVQTQKNITINTFWGSEAATALEISNSFNTAIRNVSLVEPVAGLSVKEEAGTWYLCWDGSTTIPKNTKAMLAFAVEGFEPAGDLTITPQMITVNGTNAQPTASLSSATLNFNLFPYTEQSVSLSVKNNDYQNIVVLKEGDIVLTSAPKGVDLANANVTVSYDETNARLTAKVENSAVNGIYKFTITPGVGADGAKPAKSVVLTINVKGAKPAFKLNATTVTLDAAYPGTSIALLKYMMDEGFRLKDLKVVPVNSTLKDFIDVDWTEEGNITFTLKKAGLLTAGTYTLTPIVSISTGEEVTLKDIKVSVKVSNSSGATLSSKKKSVSINPNLGEAKVDAKLSVKGFVPQDSVEYTTVYSFEPANELAQRAGMNLQVTSDAAIIVSNCEEQADGKYIYNLLGIITGDDGTVTYTKPLAFTVQLKEKALTIVPAKKSVTVYADYCTTVVKNNTEYYKIEIPVSIKEVEHMLLDMQLDNSMMENGVGTVLNENGNKLIVEFPVTLKKLSNLTITPQDSKFAPFKVSITVNEKEPKATFASKKITMNRYTDAYVSNTVVDTEGYAISGLKNVVIKKGKDIIAENYFDTKLVNGTIQVGILAEHDADIANGNYTVSVTPITMIGETEKELAACTFTLNVTQPKVKLGIETFKTSSEIVNLYPMIGERSSGKFTVKAYSDNKEIEIVEMTVSTKDKTVITTASIDGNNKVSFTTLEDAGKNTYAVNAKVRKANGTVDEKTVVLNKAFVVNAKALPKSIKLAKNKLTFSPYVESKVSTSINNAELTALMQTGDFTYRISAVETNAKYKELKTEEKNNILLIAGSTDGTVTIDNTGYVAKNTTFYYLITVELMQNGKQEPVAVYTDKLSVALKNTLPKTGLQMKTISLDNAYVNQRVMNQVILKTGNGLWTMDALTNADVMIKNGRNDVTNAGYFNVTYDGTQFVVGLNNRTADNTLMTVPKGTYKMEIIPKVSERNGDKSAVLAKVTLTIKVVSSRPTVKLTSKVNVVKGGEAVVLAPTLKNKGKLTALDYTCIKRPKNVTDTELEGIKVELLTDGTLSVKAEDTVPAGSYTFTIFPVTGIDGEEILLDAVRLTVVVK